MLTNGASAPSSRTPAQGFVLIEVLIALLIFSIATLGLVGLQVSLKRATTSAQMRAEAAYLVQALIGTMWADAANLSSYRTCSSYAPCSTWLTKLQNTLGSSATADLEICTAATSCTNDTLGYKPVGQVSITITWTVPGEAAHKYETSTSINP